MPKIPSQSSPRSVTLKLWMNRAHRLEAAASRPAFVLLPDIPPIGHPPRFEKGGHSNMLTSKRLCGRSFANRRGGLPLVLGVTLLCAAILPVSAAVPTKPAERAEAGG